MATDNVARGLAAHALSVAVAGGGNQPVESVNGKTGKVNLTAADVGAEPVGSGAKFIINLTESVGNGTYTADKAYADIKGAYDANKVIVVHLDSSELPLMNVQFAQNGGAGFTFGYTEVRTGGTSVSTRSIHYLHDAGGDKWEDSDVEGEYLSVNGGTMVGNLTLSASPVNEHDAADKSYVDNRVFKVTFTRDPLAGLNADKTIDEVNAAITDGKIVIGVIDANEYRLAYHSGGEIILSGISGNISTDIMYTNGAWSQTTETMLPTSGGNMTGDIDMGGRKITNVQKVHIDGSAPLYLGSTIEATGTSGTRLTGTTAGAAAFVKADKQTDYVPVFVGTPTDNNHSANKKYVDDVAAKELPLTGGTISGNLMVGGDMSVSGTMSALKAPASDVDVCNKAYVDSKINGVFSYDAATETLTITTV